MKLYHHPGSSSARRVTLTAAHLGLALDSQLIDLASPADRAVLLTVNPNNRIPVLIDGDFVLWESHAIMQYLCDQTPGQTLYPTAARARADVHRWLYWVSAHLAPSVGPISFERLWKKLIGQGEPDPAVIARAERFLGQCMTVLDAHLADRTWISGRELTLADYAVVSTLMYRVPTQLALDTYPNVLRHVARVEATDAWKSTEPARTR